MAVRNLVFTLNNYTEQDIEVIQGFPYDYLIYGKEVGENGTPHLQGYCELKKKTRFTTVIKWLPKIHWEVRKGTAEQAVKYCKKDGDFFEFGEMVKHQGARTDLDAVRQMAITDGMRVVSSVASMQGIRTAQMFLTYNEEPRDWVPTVYYIHGATGVGKSRRAREICDEADTYTKNDGTKWWDGYDGHEYVIIDDFRGSWWSFTEMLSLLDRYEKRVEYKGGWRQFRPRTIVITSAIPPNEVYNVGEDVNQLLRRITHVEHLVPDVPEVEG